MKFLSILLAAYLIIAVVSQGKYDRNERARIYKARQNENRKDMAKQRQKKNALTKLKNRLLKFYSAHGKKEVGAVENLAENIIKTYSNKNQGIQQKMSDISGQLKGAPDTIFGKDSASARKYNRAITQLGQKNILSGYILEAFQAKDKITKSFNTLTVGDIANQLFAAVNSTNLRNALEPSLNKINDTVIKDVVTDTLSTGLRVLNEKFNLVSRLSGFMSSMRCMFGGCQRE